MKRLCNPFLLLGLLLIAIGPSCKKEEEDPDNGIYEVSLFLISPAPNRVNIREFGKPVEVEVFFKCRGDDKYVQHAVVELQKNGASANAPRIVEETFLDSNLNSPGQYHFKHTYTPSRYMFNYINTYTSDSTGASDGPATSYFFIQDKVSEDFPIAVYIINYPNDLWVEPEMPATGSIYMQSGWKYLSQTIEPFVYRLELLDANNNPVEVLYEKLYSGKTNEDIWDFIDIPNVAPGTYYIRASASRPNGTGFNARSGRITII